MPEQYVPETYARCLMRWRLNTDAEEMVSTIGVRRGDEFVDANEVAEAVSDALLSPGGPIQDATGMLVGWTFVGVTAYLETSTGTQIGEHLENLAGTHVGQGLTNNTAILVRKNSGQGGRRNRGRMFIPPWGPLESNVTASGLLDPLDVAAITAAWNVFRDELVADPRVGVVPVIFHYPTVADPEPIVTPILSFACQNTVASQRRRMRP